MAVPLPRRAAAKSSVSSDGRTGTRNMLPVSWTRMITRSRHVDVSTNDWTRLEEQEEEEEEAWTI